MNNVDPAIVVNKEEMLRLRDGTDDLESPHAGRTAKSSVRYRLPFVVGLLKLSDIAALLIANFGGFFLRFGFDATLSRADNLFIYFSTLVMSVSLHVSKAYRERLLSSLYSQLSTLLAGVMGGLSLILMFGYLSSALSAYSRLWFIFSSCASFALLLVSRVVIMQVVHRARQADMLTDTIVVVGATERAEMVINFIRGTEQSHIKILGVFDDRVERELPVSLRSQMLGSTNTLLTYIRRHRVDRVVVALPWVATQRIEALLKKLRTVPVRIDLVTVATRAWSASKRSGRRTATAIRVGRAR